MLVSIAFRSLEKAPVMTLQDTLSIRPMEDGEEEIVIDLWKKAGLTREYNNPERDVALARQSPSSDILVGIRNGTIEASVMVGCDGHRGSVYYLSVDPDAQGSGHGRAMMDAAEAWLKTRGVWKLNLMVRETNGKVHGFYQALGYETQPRTVFTKWLEVPDTLPKD